MLLLIVIAVVFWRRRRHRQVSELEQAPLLSEHVEEAGNQEEITQEQSDNITVGHDGGDADVDPPVVDPTSF